MQLVTQSGTVAATGCYCRLEIVMLTDRQIAILCDIGQASSFDAEKKSEVVALVARGYVESTATGSRSRRAARRSWPTGAQV
jgi:hypothetical protein